MGFLGRFGGGPTMGVAYGLRTPDPAVLSEATYQITTSERGLPTVQLDLRFAATSRPVVNPDMTLAVLIDRGGSPEDWEREGYLYGVASTILDYVSPVGIGFDLVFYGRQASYGGYITNWSELQQAIVQGRYGSYLTSRSDRQQAFVGRRQGPGTYITITEALSRTVERYRTKRGIFLVVLTSGGHVFAELNNVQRFIADTLVPQLTPDNPYAFRLNFVGAKEEEDREFLRHLAAVAGGQGTQLVKHHQRGQKQDSHDDLLAELDSAFLGIDTGVVLGQDVQEGERVVVTRVGDVATYRWREGNLQDIGFVPRRASLGLEFTEPHPPSIPIRLSYGSPGAGQDLVFTVPLPRSGIPDTASPVPMSRPRFHLPWRHASPEDDVDGSSSSQ